MTKALSLFYNEPRVADLICDAVMTCECHDSIARIICSSYCNMERCTSLRDKLTEVEKIFIDLNLLLRTVELHRD